MKPALSMLLLLALLTAVPVRALDTMRCGSRLVSTGMTFAEVLAVCGEPAYRDAWPQPYGTALAALGQVEEWTYNFGSGQLLRILRFRQGLLQQIDTEGYGFARGSPGNCSGAIAPGAAKYRLIAECGEPLTRSADFLQVPADRSPRLYDPRYTPPAWAFVYREEWVYNFGPARLMRTVRLDNGRVTEVELGGRGFAR